MAGLPPEALRVLPRLRTRNGGEQRILGKHSFIDAPQHKGHALASDRASHTAWSVHVQDVHTVMGLTTACLGGPLL